MRRGEDGLTFSRTGDREKMREVEDVGTGGCSGKGVKVWNADRCSVSVGFLGIAAERVHQEVLNQRPQGRRSLPRYLPLLTRRSSLLPLSLIPLGKPCK